MRCMLVPSQTQTAPPPNFPAALASLLRGSLAWWLRASRSRRILVLLAAVWVLNGFDLSFTILAQMQGSFAELNPVARRLLPHGPVALFLYKGVALGIGSAVLWRCRRHPSAEIGAWLALAVYVGVSLRWHLYYDAISAMQQAGLLITP